MIKIENMKALSIMVPAYNEEDNLASTVYEISKGLKGKLDNYEILIFNDGSTDSTQKVALNLSKKNSKIRLFHNKNNLGMGYCYTKGLFNSKYPYYMYIPGDNQFPKEALIKMISYLNKYDIIIPFVTNMHIRHWSRRLVSYTFTFLINLFFNLNIHYFNGTVIHKTELVKKALPKSKGHAYQAEILVRLIKSGASYVEVSYKMVERKAGLTSAFKFKNIKSVLSAIILLFWDVQIQGKLLNEKI